MKVFTEELINLIDKHFIGEENVLLEAYIKACLDIYNTESQPKTFEQELENLINRYSLENDSNTPDFILAKHLKGCLEIFNVTMTNRDKWYDINQKSYNLEELNNEPEPVQETPS